MVWVFIIFLVAIGISLVVARDELTELQAIFFGGTLPAGCAIAEGVLFLLGALGVYLAYRSGVLGI